MIAGVCAALARRFDVSPTLVRVLFVLSCILPGPQVLLYLGLWLIILVARLATCIQRCAVGAPRFAGIREALAVATFRAAEGDRRGIAVVRIGRSGSA